MPGRIVSGGARVESWRTADRAHKCPAAEQESTRHSSQCYLCVTTCRATSMHFTVHLKILATCLNINNSSCRDWIETLSTSLEAQGFQGVSQAML